MKQAGRSVDWLLNAACSLQADPSAAEMEVRKRVTLAAMKLPAWGDIEACLVEVSPAGSVRFASYAGFRCA